MTQKRLEKTETLKREELADWFIKAVDKQVPNFDFVDVKYYVDGEGWHSQEMVAYKR